MIDFVAVGKKIATLRKEQNLTQDDVANSLYVTRQLISKWEKGIGVPHIDQIIEIAKLFHTSIEEILCLNDNDNVDVNNIFNGHDRLYIVKQIINGKINVYLPDVFYQFSPVERMMVLKAINEGKLETNLNELKRKLTNLELKYLGKRGKNNDTN